MSASSGSDGSQLPELPGPFEVKALIARGGMGAIYCAEDPRLAREVAVKVGAGSVDDFLREARLTGGLEHPHIVPVHSAGLDARGAPYFVMTLIRGQTLQELIDEGTDGGPPGSQAALEACLEVLTKVCDAVAFAHAQGILHLDLKPENVMVGAFGEVTLMDWGLARRTDDPGEDQAVLAGTPRFMAPEQAAGEASRLGPHTDVYGLGSILYAILTGHPPHASRAGVSRIAMLREIMEGSVPAPSERAPERAIAPALEAICVKALAREPEERYGSAQALAADLRGAQEDRAVSVIAESAWTQLRRLARHHPLVAALLLGSGLAFAALTGITLIAVQRSAEEARSALSQARVEQRQAEAAKASAEAALAASEVEAQRKEEAESARAREAERRAELLQLQREGLSGARPVEEVAARLAELQAAAPTLEEREAVALRAAQLWLARRDFARLDAVLEEPRGAGEEGGGFARLRLNAALMRLRGLDPRFLETLEAVARVEPDSGAAQLRRALDADGAARVQLAAQALARNPNLTPAAVIVLYDRRSRRLGPAELLERCERALEVSPNYADARLLRARLLRDLSRGAEARVELEQILRLGRRDVYVWHELMELAEDAGEVAQALRYADRGCQVAPDQAWIFARRAELSLREGLPRAEEDLAALDARDAGLAARVREQAASGAGGEAERLNSRGYHVWTRLGRPKEAIPLFEAALAADSRCVPALLNLSDLLAELGDLARAETYAERVIAVAPRDLRGYLNTGSCRQRLERLPEALEAYRSGAAQVESAAEQALLLTQAASIELEVEGPEAAAETLARALSLDESWGRSFTVRGRIAERRGELEAALEAYDRAIALGDAIAVWARGRLRARLGRTEAAQADLLRARELKPQAAALIDAELRRLRAGR